MLKSERHRHVRPTLSLYSTAYIFGLVLAIIRGKNALMAYRMMTGCQNCSLKSSSSANIVRYRLKLEKCSIK